jgi:hypothetical protein
MMVNDGIKNKIDVILNKEYIHNKVYLKKEQKS